MVTESHRQIGTTPDIVRPGSWDVRTFTNWLIAYLPRCVFEGCTVCVPRRPWRWANGLACILVLCLGTVAFPVQADDSLTASLEYTVDPDSYDNAILASYVGEMLYPRIVVDRARSSPFYGTIYLVGIQGGSCPRPVVVRSLDHGQTWEPPRVADVCVSGSGLDAAVDNDGTLWAAAWGPKVFRSVNGGANWSLAADLGRSSSPVSLAYDSASGALYLAWAALDIVDGGASTALQGPVRVAESVDGGDTWSRPADLPLTAVRASFPDLSAYNETVVLSAVAQAGTSDPFVAVVASQDLGRTWSSLREMSPPNPCALWSSPSVAVSRSGVFAVSWFETHGATSPSSCWDVGGASTEAAVSVSEDGGQTFSNPTLVGGPPVWPSADYLGGRTVFDDESRLYVSWFSVAADGAAIYVSHSDFTGDFQTASFTTQLRLSAGNATGQQNLAVAPDGMVYLVWRAEAFPFEPPTSGIFVRGVSGEATGGVVFGGAAAAADGIEIELRDPRSLHFAATAAWEGSNAVVGGLPPATYDLWLHLQDTSVQVGSLPVVAWGRTSFRIGVEEFPSGNRESPAQFWAAMGIAAMTLSLAAVFAALQYVRIEREDIFQRRIRLVMFDYVREHPGSSFSEVRDVMGLKNGAASYHLSVLERQGFLHSESRRRHRWYYANGDVTLWKELPISSIQQSILDEVRRVPGVGVRELARTVNRRPSSVSDNVKALTREGLIRTERTGRKLQCYPKNGSIGS